MDMDLTSYLSLQSEIRQLKRQVRNLQNENSRLRALTGVKKRNSKKAECVKHYRPGMTGGQLAKLAGCSVRYANRLISTFTHP